MKTADKLFTEEQKLQIVETTRLAESHTTGEIVVLVADKSSHYYDLKAAGAISLSALVSLLVSISIFHGSFWHWLLLSATLVPLSFLFFAQAQTFTLSLAPHRRIEKTVHDGAVSAFYKHGLDKTKGQTGVLFYISLIEQRVLVLADKGIHEKITQQVLNRHAGDMAKGIKAGHACEALVQAITDIGKVLATCFPGVPAAVNELPDYVLSDGDTPSVDLT